MNFSKHIISLLSFAFGIFIFIGLYNKSTFNYSLFLSILLSIILYVICIIYPVKNFTNKNFYLNDFFKISIFYFIVFKYLKHELILDQEVIFFNFNSIVLSDFHNVLFIVLVSVFSLDITSVFFKKKKSTNNKFHLISNIWLPLIILFIATIINLILGVYGFSGYGSSLDYTYGIFSFFKTFSSVILPISLVTSCYILFSPFHSKPKSFIYLFYFSFISNILIGLMSGMKEEVIIPIISYLILYFYFGKRLSLLNIFSLLFFIIILYPINNNYRYFLNNSNTNQSKTLIFQKSLFSLVNNNFNFLKLVDNSLSDYTSRTNLIGQLDHAIKTSDNNKWSEYKNMNRYWSLPLFPFIPRALWNEKPRNDMGLKFYHYQSGFYKNSSNSVTVTSIGWAYLEGGIFFVIIIFILLGLCFNVIDLKSKTSLKYLIIWVIAFKTVIKPEWDPFFNLSFLFQTFILLSIFLFFLQPKKIVI